MPVNDERPRFIQADVDFIIQTRREGWVLTPYEGDVLINEIHRLRMELTRLSEERCDWDCSYCREEA